MKHTEESRELLSTGAQINHGSSGVHSDMPRALKLLLICIGGLLVGIVLLTIICALLIGHNQRFILNESDEISPKGIKVALVLGGGIGRNNQPTDVVISRLDAAADLYEAGAVQKLLVSGDNRFLNYNEPRVMQDYLADKRGIPLENIQQDNAGRSTYESCDRAKHIFGLNQVILVSQRSHLARAIYLCRSFGIESYGYPATNEHRRTSQTVRELAANVKAVYNIYIRGEPTIMGEQIPL